MRRVVAILVILAFVLAAAAFGIWRVSSAHGHGLASPDRIAITLLGLGSVACLAAARIMEVRRGR